MATILCQSCKQPMDVPAEMGGQTMACPHCGAQFVAPRAAAPRVPPIKPMTQLPFSPPPSAPTPPTFQPVAPMPPAPTFAPVLEEPGAKPSGRPLRERPVTLLDVFDLTFARFVTPIIVKIIWVIILILAGLWLLLLTFLLVMGLIGSSGVGMSSFGAGPAIGAESRLVAALIQIVIYCFQVAATGAALLFWRLMLESIMILFSVSNSLKSIDRKTRPE